MAWVIEDHIVIVVLLCLFFTVCATLYMMYRERRHSIEKIRMLGWQEQQGQQQGQYAGDQGQYAGDLGVPQYGAQQYLPQAVPVAPPRNWQPYGQPVDGHGWQQQGYGQ
jgi:hypothetical protein